MLFEKALGYKKHGFHFFLVLFLSSQYISESFGTFGQTLTMDLPIENEQEAAVAFLLRAVLSIRNIMN